MMKENVDLVEIKLRQENDIPESHKLKMVHLESLRIRKGEDIDLEIWHQIDESGEVVEIYTVHDSMSIYPPFARTISWTKE